MVSNLWRRMLGLLTGTLAAASSATGQVLAPSDLPFGFKSAWIAVRSDQPTLVIEALGGTDCRKVMWGVDAQRNAVGDRTWMIVSPPFRGWILVGGKPINDWPAFGGPKPPLDDRETLARLSALSERFDEVHYYGTHRVIETHMWSLFRHGRLVRLFKYSGERGEYW